MRIQEKGSHMLDYTCLRTKPGQIDKEEFNGRQFFLDSYDKWRKIFKHSRKKEFKFANLMKFMQNN